VIKDHRNIVQYLFKQFSEKLVLSKELFLNRWAMAQYLTLALVIPGPRLIEKGIYVAMVCQRLRTTALRRLNTVKLFMLYTKNISSCSSV
jgi:hypothetical protein